jgi:hypothetical protein
MVLDNDIFKTFNGQKAAKVQVHLDYFVQTIRFS